MISKNFKKFGFTIAELMIVVSVIAILAVIAIPVYMKFQARAKQSEACIQLDGASKSQHTYIAVNNVAGKTFRAIYWTPEGKPRYTYYLENDVIGKMDPSHVQSGIISHVEGKKFTITATGNIDGDKDLDYWYIANSRQCQNHHNDI